MLEFEIRLLIFACNRTVWLKYLNAGLSRLRNGHEVLNTVDEDRFEVLGTAIIVYAYLKANIS